ncbi:D-2-hydroxyacid dehydrogenase [Bacillaceae bacterium SIJ1]|uniref:D-2-hydroxyacid dehydrogenase n=1 Tax=Litoribacterium kuwaitense TaxID=1398745 RepID=UPI0013EBFFF2|nr:D-2-hydroxyacid dehydrogenase [Litoribacterium kuwaitense]NGP46581.1 D-2-hydroxyacid dehydrogenase [Litoribacterium kuwaitense]
MIALLTEDFSFDQRTKLIEAYPSIEWHLYSSLDQSEYLTKAELLITYGNDVKERHIQSAASLKWIMIISAGMEEMPFAAIANKGITVTNVKGIHKIPMAEYTLSWMLNSVRKNDVIRAKEHEKSWAYELPMAELHGKRVVIAGAGAIGAEIGRLCKAFGMHTVGVNSDGRPTDHMDDMATLASWSKYLQQADFIVNVLPSTRGTKHLFNKQTFAHFNPLAVFINIGRGSTVNERDLLEALEAGMFAHAVLDVFAEEPLPKSSPFWEHPRISVTPHHSGVSTKYDERALHIVMKNMDAFLNKTDQWLNKVDPHKGY